MAGRKRKPDSPNPDAFVVSDNDHDDNSTSPAPARSLKRIKQTKPSTPSTTTGPAQSHRDAENNIYWEISRARRVTVSDYRGKKMIHLREYYEKDGNQLPGKKGISLTLEQYNALLGVVPAIEKELIRSGVEDENVVRVVYEEEDTVGGEDGAVGVKDEEDGEADDGDGDGNEEDASDGSGGRVGGNGDRKGRKNHEATSDEEDE